MNERPSVGLSFLVTTLLFFGGAGGGAALGHFCAPNSALTGAVSFVAPPFAMFVGFWGWLGAALFSAAWSLIRRVFLKVEASTFAPDIPPGSFAFVPIATFMMAAVGIVAAFSTERFSFVETLAIYVAVGGVYGVALWRSAKTGLLPFPSEA